MPLSALDIIEVCQAKYRYAYALDGRDWEGYRALLADEVLVDFRGLGYRGEPRRKQAASWVSQVRALLDGFATTQHVMTSPLVQEDGDEVTLTVYLQAHHVLDLNDPPGRHYTIGGRYEDRLRRQDGRWLFSALTLHNLWTQGDAAIMEEAAARVSAQRASS
jgi:hypothetical protein